VTTRDLFHIGSCTKAMTAFLIERLVEDGQFKRSELVANLCPRLGARMHKDLKEVLTLDHCLGHRGGFVDSDRTFENIPESSFRLTGARARFDYARRMLARPPLYPPGTKYIYSNVGHVVAAIVAEEKLGKPWEHLMNQYVFLPLKMTTVGYGAPGSAQRVDQPWPHKADGNRQTPVPPGPKADNAELIGPATRVHCSMADWAKFLSYFLTSDQELAAEKQPLLSAAARERLLAPGFGRLKDFGYAGGWRRDRSPVYGRTLKHDGTNTLNFCHAYLLTEKRFGVLVATNTGIDSAKRACDQVRSRATRDWFNGGLTYTQLRNIGQPAARNRNRDLQATLWMRRLRAYQIQASKPLLPANVFEFLASKEGWDLCLKLRNLGEPTKLEFVKRGKEDEIEFDVFRVTFKDAVWRFEFARRGNNVTWLRLSTPFE